MPFTSIFRKLQLRPMLATSLILLQVFSPLARAQDNESKSAEELRTATPIKHVIVIIGENRTFDNIFATYVPRQGSVSNLLSKGIIHEDGSPGPNAALATQFQIANISPATYFIDTRQLVNPGKTAYAPFLPTPEAGGAPPIAVTRPQFLKDPVDAAPPFDAKTFSTAQLGILSPETETEDLFLLTTGATGLSNCNPDPTLPPFACAEPDTRIANFNKLPNTSFQIHMTATPVTWCIACSICGSNPIAACLTPRPRIRPAAKMTCCPSSVLRAAMTAAATPWASTTSRTAMRRSSSVWPMNTP